MTCRDCKYILTSNTRTHYCMQAGYPVELHNALSGCGLFEERRSLKDAVKCFNCFYVNSSQCPKRNNDPTYEDGCPDWDALHVEKPVEGLKLDTEKPRWDLLPLSLPSKCVDVLTFGAKKYAPNNWQKVEDAEERYYAALMRHLFLWRQGERTDSESGISHLGHAMCNLVFLDYFENGK